MTWKAYRPHYAIDGGSPHEFEEVIAPRGTTTGISIIRTVDAFGYHSLHLSFDDIKYMIECYGNAQQLSNSAAQQFRLRNNMMTTAFSDAPKDSCDEPGRKATSESRSSLHLRSDSKNWTRSRMRLMKARVRYEKRHATREGLGRCPVLAVDPR